MPTRSLHGELQESVVGLPSSPYILVHIFLPLLSLKSRSLVCRDPRHLSFRLRGQLLGAFLVFGNIVYDHLTSKTLCRTVSVPVAPAASALLIAVAWSHVWYVAMVDVAVVMRLGVRGLACIHTSGFHLTGEGLRSGSTPSPRHFPGLALEGVRLRSPKALAGLVASSVGLTFAKRFVGGGVIECRLVESSVINGDRISKCVNKLTFDGCTILSGRCVLWCRLSPAGSSIRTRVGWGIDRIIT